jgi:hypothetical protein
MGCIGLVGEILHASGELRLAANLALLLVVLPLTYITFFTPMWSVHTEMIKKKTEFEGDRSLQLAKLDDKIQPLIQLEKFTEARKVMDEINLIKSSSPEKFPVWPFDTAIFARFLTPQVVPVISFIIGVKNQDYVSIMDYLISLK